MGVEIHKMSCIRVRLQINLDAIFNMKFYYLLKKYHQCQIDVKFILTNNFEN